MRPRAFAWYQRPARDRNYEFWGDQTFFGQNPPQAARLSWFNKKDVGDVKLRITDAAGREVREISGPALANSNKAGIQTACWDLRVAPVPNPDLGQGAGRGQGGGQGRRRPGRRPAAGSSRRRTRSAPDAAAVAAASVDSAAAVAAATPVRSCCRAPTTSR